MQFVDPPLSLVDPPLSATVFTVKALRQLTPPPPYNQAISTNVYSQGVVAPLDVGLPDRLFL